MIKFIWFVMICCGIANGLIYSYVQPSVKLIYMMVVTLICGVLLILHHRVTKKWCINKECNDYVDYDEDHARIFVNSFVIAFVLLVIACLIGHMGFIVAMVTMMVTFLFAAFREAMYT